MMFISFNVIHLQWYIPWKVKEFVGLLKQLFLMCTFQTTGNDINVSYMLLNVMDKNQQIRGRFMLRLPFCNFKRDKRLSQLLLQFTLYVVLHFIQFSHALSCTPITLVQLLQVWIIFNDLLNLLLNYIFKKSLRPFSSKLIVAAFKSLAGHSKSVFINEGRERGVLKSRQKQIGWGGSSMCVCSLFFKKCLDFQNEVLYLFSSFSYWL